MESEEKLIELMKLWRRLDHLMEGEIVLPDDADVMEKIDKLLGCDI